MHLVYAILCIHVLYVLMYECSFSDEPLLPLLMIVEDYLSLVHIVKILYKVT